MDAPSNNPKDRSGTVELVSPLQKRPLGRTLSDSRSAPCGCKVA
jgi:hypothetical protein